MSSELIELFFLGVLAGFVLFVAYKRAFFSFSDQKPSWSFPLCWYHVVGAFFIYFAVAYLISPLIASLFKQALQKNSGDGVLKYVSWMNAIVSSCVLFFLTLYLFCLKKIVREKIWRKGDRFDPLADFRMGILAWIVSFPTILFLSNLSEFFLTHLLKIPSLPEQLAVYFLKMTFASPSYFSLAVFTIVILAPLTEELLFRGFLQSFIRKHLGSKQAIVLTALSFSLFHFSPEQGFANISIIFSLFALALFLGFLYEKRGSLLAPMALHASFNAISVINLYFLGDFPQGPI